jgi:hypothetical protein
LKGTFDQTLEETPELNLKRERQMCYDLGYTCEPDMDRKHLQKIKGNRLQGTLLNKSGNRQNIKHGLLNNEFLKSNRGPPAPRRRNWLAVMAAKRDEAGMIADVLHEYDLKPRPTRFRLAEAPDICAEGRLRKLKRRKDRKFRKKQVQEIEDKKGQITKHSDIIDALTTAIESECPRMTAILLEEV